MAKSTLEELQVQIQYAMVERLSTSQQRQATLLRLLDECIFECDTTMRLTYSNPAWQKQLGYSSADLIQKDLTTMLADSEQVMQWLNYKAALLTATAPEITQLQLRHNNGKVIWFELSMIKNGEAGYIGSLHYIQNHKNLTAQLIKQQHFSRMLSLVASHTSNLVIITDRQGYIEWVNRSFEQRTGYLLPQVIGKRPGTFLQGEDTDKNTISIMAKAIHDGKSFTVEVLNYDINKQPYWVEINTSAVFNESGELTHYIAVQTDISERKSFLNALQEAKKQAEALSKAKSRFMANISHEIRTPLNAIVGAAEILRDTGLSREQARYTDMISVGSEALMSVIDDVLTYSRLEANAIEFQQQPFRLDCCLEEAIDMVAQSAIAKQLALILDIQPQTPLIINSDKTRIRQVLINLLANAIKFTEQGQVLVSVNRQLSGADNVLMIKVRDTGIGIASNRLTDIFEPFTQLDDSSTRQQGGSGLGLTICRQICEAAGGSISVESELGAGSTFSVLFPLHKMAVACDITADLHKDYQSNDFKIVGQDATVNQAVANMLASHKLTYSEFTDVDKLPATAPGKSDIILLTSPLSNEQIIWLGAWQSRAVSSYILQFNLLESGKSFVLKQSNYLQLNGPFKPSHFVQALEILDDPDINQPLRPFDYHGAETVSGPLLYKGKHVLIVEDNPNNKIVLRELLLQKGCQVDCVEHGAAALAFLSQNSTDLILMDIQMPVMDGITATRTIRSASTHYNKVTIIAVTANAIEGDKERFLAAGMNDYLAKPISKTKLYGLLDHYLTPGNIHTSSKLARLKAVMQHMLPYHPNN